MQPWVEGFDNQWRVKAAGEPKTVMAVSMPSVAQFLRLEQKMLDGMTVDQSIQYRKFTRALEQTWGFPGEDWLRALGNEMVMFTDQAGEYLAVEIRDAVKLEQIFQTLSGKPKPAYAVRTVKGVDIHHMVLPQVLVQGNPEAWDKLPPLVKTLAEGKQHLYWVREGNYLIFAGVPQMLLDRAALSQRTELGPWIRDQQKQRGARALLLASTHIDQAPRRTYYAYLQILTYLADLAAVELDIYSLPTARDLGLPEQGTFGAQLDVSPSQLAMELTFESTPFEVFMDPGSGGAAAIAMTGIMAAIAIPAYHDYTLRAKVNAGLAEAVPVRARVAEFHQKHGRFPNAEEIVLMGFEPGRTVKLSLVPMTGVVVVTYRDDKELAGKRVVLVPEASGKNLSWDCKGEMDNRYLPASCRQ